MARRIVSDASILGGTPVIDGTRIPVYLILDYLADSYSVGGILSDFPHLTAEDISAALEYASQLPENQPPFRRSSLRFLTDETLPPQRSPCCAV